MKIKAVGDGIATFSVSPKEERDLHRVAGEAPKADWGVYWKGPKDGAWWDAWKKATPHTQGRPEIAVGEVFDVTEGHLALLRRSYTGWQYCEFGATEINPKRPYGNSDVICDIAEIVDGVRTEEPTPEAAARYARLHRETEFCIQILLQLHCITVGSYRNIGDPLFPEWEEFEHAPEVSP